jgi:hypothetical protein
MDSPLSVSVTITRYGNSYKTLEDALEAIG